MLGHASCLLAVAGERRGDLSRELADVERLLEVVVESGREEPLAIRPSSRTRSARSPGCRRSPGSARRRPSACTPSMPGSWTSIRTRPGCRRAREREPVLGVLGLEGLVAGVVEDVARELQVPRVVLDDEDERPIGHVASTSGAASRPRGRRGRRARPAANVALLRQVADLAGEPLVVGARHVLRRQHDDRDVADERVGAQLLDDREAVDVGHQQVEHARRPAARAARLARPPRRPLARSTAPALGREHRLEEVQIDRVVVDRHQRARLAPAATTQRASASSRRARSTGLTRYSAAPSANPAPCSSIIETITTGIVRRRGIALELREQLPAVQPRQQDVEDHRRRARAAAPARAPRRRRGRSTRRSRRPRGRRAAGRPSAGRPPRPGRCPCRRPRGDRLAGSRAGRRALRTRARRDRERERAADAGLALHPQPPAVQLDDPLRQREAEPGALRAGPRRATAALERLEDALLLRLGDADAGVAHAHLRLVAHSPGR